MQCISKSALVAWYSYLNNVTKRAREYESIYPTYMTRAGKENKEIGD